MRVLKYLTGIKAGNEKGTTTLSRASLPLPGQVLLHSHHTSQFYQKDAPLPGQASADPSPTVQDDIYTQTIQVPHHLPLPPVPRPTPAWPEDRRCVCISCSQAQGGLRNSLWHPAFTVMNSEDQVWGYLPRRGISWFNMSLPGSFWYPGAQVKALELASWWSRVLNPDDTLCREQESPAVPTSPVASPTSQACPGPVFYSQMESRQ